VYEAGACGAGACEAGACGAGAGKQKEMSRNNIWPAIWSGDLSLSLQQVPKAYGIALTSPSLVISLCLSASGPMFPRPSLSHTHSLSRSRSLALYIFAPPPRPRHTHLQQATELLQQGRINREEFGKLTCYLTCSSRRLLQNSIRGGGGKREGRGDEISLEIDGEQGGGEGGGVSLSGGERYVSLSHSLEIGADVQGASRELQACANGTSSSTRDELGQEDEARESGQRGAPQLLLPAAEEGKRRVGGRCVWLWQMDRWLSQPVFV
jgi:hypothetical protein